MVKDMTTERKQDQQYNTEAAEVKGEENSQLRILYKKIESFGVFESEPCLEHRLAILSRLEPIASIFDARIVVSDLIQLNLPGIDIDAVCVTRQNIEPKNFLGQFTEELKKHPKFEQYHIIDISASQHLEVIFDGSTIRLSFASLQLDELPSRISVTHPELTKTDPKSYFNIGFSNDLEHFSISYPNAVLDEYLLTLRTIKTWAKRRGIYSPAHDYFECMSWSQKVGKFFASHRFPQSLSHFFSSFLQQKKRKRRRLQDWDSSSLGDPLILVWDKGIPDIQKRFVLHELKRASRLIENVLQGVATWDEFFREPQFFSEYNDFLVLLLRSPADDVGLEWPRLIELYLHIVSDILENNASVELVHANPKRYEQRQKPFQRRTSCNEALNCSMWFIAIQKKSEEPNDNFIHSIATAIQKFERMLLKTPKAIDLLRNQGFEIEVRNISHSRLCFLLKKEDLLENSHEGSQVSEGDYDERVYISKISVTAASAEETVSSVIGVNE